MEGVKTRLQVQYSETHTGVKNRYTGTVDCYRKVYQEVGAAASEASECMI